VEITGTIQAPDGSFECVSVQGATYEDAREILNEKFPEGHKLLAIRTDRLILPVGGPGPRQGPMGLFRGSCPR
jgi:hypothetical protein